MSKFGYYGKFRVEKGDGSEIDPNADYFVLRLDTDRHARKAIIAYAQSIWGEDHELAVKLMQKVQWYEDQPTKEGEK